MDWTALEHKHSNKLSAQMYKNTVGSFVQDNRQLTYQQFSTERSAPQHQHCKKYMLLQCSQKIHSSYFFFRSTDLTRIAVKISAVLLNCNKTNVPLYAIQQGRQRNCSCAFLVGYKWNMHAISRYQFDQSNLFSSIHHPSYKVIKKPQHLCKKCNMKIC